MKKVGPNTRRDFLTMSVAAAVGTGVTVDAKARSIEKQNEEELAAVSEQEGETKVYMLNALWFKPDGGAQKYAEYGLAVGPIVAKYGGKVDGRTYLPQQAMIGDFDADLVFFVEWPSLEAFQTFLQDPALPEASSLRSEATSNSLLIQCVEAPH